VLDAQQREDVGICHQSAFSVIAVYLCQVCLPALCLFVCLWCVHVCLCVYLGVCVHVYPIPLNHITHCLYLLLHQYQPVQSIRFCDHNFLVLLLTTSEFGSVQIH